MEGEINNGTPATEKKLIQSESKEKDGKDGEEKEKELTEEEKAAKKEKYAKANAKAKEMIKEIFRTYRCQIILGLLGNIVGMAAELLSPLYVGYIIDAIIKRDKDQVNNLVIIWMSITVGSSVINGLQAFILNNLTQKIGYKLR